MADGKIVDDLAVERGDGEEAELTIFVLRAEALERGEAGDATEPGESVGDADAVEAKRERGAIGGGEGDGELPRSGRAGGDGAGGAVVEENGETGGAGFETARVGVRANFAADDETAHAAERGQVNGAALANPAGVGGELIEENARVVGEAPGVGAAGGGRARSGTHGVKSAGAKGGRRGLAKLNGVGGAGGVQKFGLRACVGRRGALSRCHLLQQARRAPSSSRDSTPTILFSNFGRALARGAARACHDAGVGDAL